jgi:heptosyltransferase-3
MDDIARRSSVNRALLIHGGALGDFVMALRLVQTLRENGIAQVHGAMRGPHARLAQQCKAVERGFDIETLGWHGLFATNGGLHPDISRVLSEYELVLNMLPGPGPRRNVESLGSVRYIEIDPVLRSEWGGHISDQWLKDFEGHGFHACGGLPNLKMDTRDTARGRELLTQHGISGDVVVIHPGSGGRHKCYPLREYVELGETLQSRGIATVFTLGEVEMERMGGDDIGALSKRFIVLRELTLIQLAAVLCSANVFVGNDSGVSHLAAALGTPTVAVFGPTDPTVWRPLGTRVSVCRGVAGAWPVHSEILGVTNALLEPAK